jgi:hypothetical protein
VKVYAYIDTYYDPAHGFQVHVLQCLREKTKDIDVQEFEVESIDKLFYDGEKIRVLN